MIRNITLSQFKNIEHESFEISPLTILTGLNSTGKSTIGQALLLANQYLNPSSRTRLLKLPIDFDTLRNKYVRAQRITLDITTERNRYTLMIEENKSEFTESVDFVEDLGFESHFFYLSANRVGTEDSAQISTFEKVGLNGEYLLGTFEAEKSNPVIAALQRESSSSTLSAQVNYWLTQISGIKFEFQTEKRSSTQLDVKFKSDGLAIHPSQLGTGISFLVKVIIMALRAQKGDILVIENPEIHLHPAAQSRLGEFFAFVANSGVQLIIETHCEHMINRIQYEVYKKQIQANDVVIYYKGGITTPFEKVTLKADGNFGVEFPLGFFDATLDLLLQM